MSAYISTDLNMVKALDPDRHALALQMEAFLNKGGTIEVLPFWVSHEEPKKPNTMTPNFQSPGVMEETNQQAARIRKMAKTMNGAEICDKEGISRGILRGIGRRYSIEFPVGVKNAIAPNKATPEAELRLIPRIQACIDQGLTRNKCSKELRISSTLLSRLITDHNLNYPKCNAGPRPQPEGI